MGDELRKMVDLLARKGILIHDDAERKRRLKSLTDAEIIALGASVLAAGDQLMAAGSTFSGAQEIMMLCCDACGHGFAAHGEEHDKDCPGHGKKTFNKPEGCTCVGGPTLGVCGIDGCACAEFDSGEEIGEIIEALSDDDDDDDDEEWENPGLGSSDDTDGGVG